MHKSLYIPLICAAFAACNNASDSDGANADTTNNTDTMQSTHNTLSDQERADGWVSLFDGQSTSGWHSYGKPAAGSAWKVQDGAIYLDTSSKVDWQIKGGGDLVTNDEFENFHFKIDWKVAPKGNSGIIFYVHEDSVKYEHTWHTGPEMQVLDNAGHSDANINKHRAGDLYDLISSKEAVKPAGEWNQVEIMSNNGKLDFFMNGQNVLTTTMWDDNWRKMIAGSKFREWPDFGTFKKGRIALQDHGDAIWYRNIKIKKL